MYDERKEVIMFCSVASYAVHGIEASRICVEVDVGNGLPCFDMVGYLAGEVREARERVRVALKNSGYHLPAKRITVNLSPADMRKGGTAFDLPIAIGILGGLEQLPTEFLEGVCMIGELGLDGTIRPVPGVLSCVSEAKRQGFAEILVPIDNAEEGALVDGIDVYGVRNLTEAVEHFTGTNKLPVEKKAWCPKSGGNVPDFSDVYGQFLAKRAAEIAVAGMHNLLLLGPPGSGKSMLAGRIPGIMPDLSFEESLELTKIYSVAGLLGAEQPMVLSRPFRSPHHTISVPALVGGGQFPVPGEISLATHGVLFLDEFPEFRRGSIEVLRQPLEEKRVHISRLHGNYVFPAKFMLVAAMNPCPCGHFPDRNRCHCSQDQIQRYLGRISQPILDRIDLCVEMPSLAAHDIENGPKGESSATIRSRVEAARKRQEERFADAGIYFNSEIASSALDKYCPLSETVKGILRNATDRYGFSARVYHRIIKVSRTIADLDGSDEILEKHMQEAVVYHALDHKYRVM